LLWIGLKEDEAIRESNISPPEGSSFNPNVVQRLNNIMENSPNQKRAIITGASSGIGKAVAIKFAQAGIDVC